MSFQRPADYAGELSVAEAYALLGEDEHAALVDVRTQAEWTMSAFPISAAWQDGRSSCEWQTIPRCGVPAISCRR